MDVSKVAKFLLRSFLQFCGIIAIGLVLILFLGAHLGPSHVAAVGLPLAIIAALVSIVLRFVRGPGRDRDADP